ncbi:hypothetical protein RCZ04_16780 [Capnocytophaga sp. HP1101]
MEIRWTEEAIKHLEETLDFWNKHNYSNIYPNKIISELNQVELAIAENPYFLAKFIESVRLYQRHFLKGKFSLYYDIIEEENVVIIKFFRSSSQKPL